MVLGVFTGLTIFFFSPNHKEKIRENGNEKKNYHYFFYILLLIIKT